MLKDKTTFITYNDKTYPVNIYVKKKRPGSISCRFRNNTFIVYASAFVKEKTIMDLLNNKWAKYFLKKSKNIPIGEDYIYIFGNKYDFIVPGKIKFSNGEILSYSSIDEFNKKMINIFKNVLIERVKYYENRMMLPEHKISVKNMSSRYGSNSCSKYHLSFALILYHYSFDIIDAVVVHELAHSLVPNHSKVFYDVVYKYCPNYKALHDKLRKGIYQ